VWLSLTVVATVLPANGKGRTGQALGNPILQKESKVKVVDGILAASVLVGIEINAAVGWWWTDPLAGLVIVLYGLGEGYRALQGEP